MTGGVPTWTSADPAAWEAARRALPPEPPPPWPGVTEYLADVGLRLQRWLLGWIEGAVPAWLASEALWLALVYGVAALAVAGLVVFVLRRWAGRRVGAPSEHGHPLAPVALAAEIPGPEEWRRRFASALARERWVAALESLWWWAAAVLRPPGLSATWTTEDLLRRSARSELAPPFRELDRLRFGTGAVGRAVLVELDSRLREVLE
jgi:hypothetical protein